MKMLVRCNLVNNQVNVLDAIFLTILTLMVAMDLHSRVAGDHWSQLLLLQHQQSSCCNRQQQSQATTPGPNLLSHRVMKGLKDAVKYKN